MSSIGTSVYCAGVSAARYEARVVLLRASQTSAEPEIRLDQLGFAQDCAALESNSNPTIGSLLVSHASCLTADRIDIEGRLVTIDRQLQRIGDAMKHTTPKGEKARTIRVPEPVALELRRHLREHQGGGLLFRTPRSGEPMRRDQFYKSAWRPALIAAELASDRYKFHGLRHFCASSLLAEGVNPMAVAGHLGDTLETLQRVDAHWLRDDRDVPADALESILVGSRLGQVAS